MNFWWKKMLLHKGFYAIVSRGAPSNLSTRRNLASVWKRTVWKRRSFVVLRKAIIHGSQYGGFIRIRTAYPYELWLNTFTYLIRWKIWVDLEKAKVLFWSRVGGENRVKLDRYSVLQDRLWKSRFHLDILNFLWNLDIKIFSSGQ